MRERDPSDDDGIIYNIIIICSPESLSLGLMMTYSARGCSSYIIYNIYAMPMR